MAEKKTAGHALIRVRGFHCRDKRKARGLQAQLA